MATQTENLGLTKPDTAEGYDIAVFNANADIVDNAVGALQNELGGTGGGLGDKVDALQADMTAARSEIAAVKTDTEALAQALASANANIATLLTQNGSVKRIFNGASTTSTSTATVDIAIPSDMDQTKCIVYTPTNVSWRKSGATITFFLSGGGGQSFTYQIIEFY